MILTEGKIECKPEDTGYDSGRIPILNAHFQRMIDANELQGATYCIAKNGKVIAYNGIGKMSFRPDDDRPLLPDSVHDIASITKIITAAAIFQLVEDGLIRLDNFAGEYLPQLNKPPFNEINIAHLLSHTSGLNPDSGCFSDEKAPNPWDEISKLDENNGDDKDWISAALKTGMRRKPGEEWQYCSVGYAFLGAIIEKVTGVFAEKYISERIIKPLKMNDTMFDLNPAAAKRHIIRDEKMEKALNVIIDGIENKENNKDTVWRLVPGTPGRLQSTAYDLVRFGNALCYFGRFDNTRILGKKAVEKMSAPYLFNVPNYCWGAKDKSRMYGLGPDLRNTLSIVASTGIYFHEGWGACSLSIDPHEQLVAAWFVPFVDQTKWYANSLFNVMSIIWSGIL